MMVLVAADSLQVSKYELNKHAHWYLSVSTLNRINSREGNYYEM